MENLLTVVATIFVMSWFAKIICYLFDSYDTGMGKVGGLIMSTFMMYSKEDIEEDERDFEKIRMRVNNICGYIMLAIVLSILAGLLIYIIFR